MALLRPLEEAGTLVKRSREEVANLLQVCGGGGGVLKKSPCLTEWLCPALPSSCMHMNTLMNTVHARISRHIPQPDLHGSLLCRTSQCLSVRPRSWAVPCCCPWGQTRRASMWPRYVGGCHQISHDNTGLRWHQADEICTMISNGSQKDPRMLSVPALCSWVPAVSTPCHVLQHVFTSCLASCLPPHAAGRFLC
jgi:hypothetical protein